jgi:hypothetical protein
MSRPKIEDSRKPTEDEEQDVWNDPDLMPPPVVMVEDDDNESHMF